MFTGAVSRLAQYSQSERVTVRRVLRLGYGDSLAGSDFGNRGDAMEPPRQDGTAATRWNRRDGERDARAYH